MLLTSDEHCIGRLVKDTCFQILSPTVSAYHCKIYKKMIATGNGDMENPSNVCIFLKDSR